MSSRGNLEKIIRTMPDPRLAMFVISCHVDKPLQEEEPQSIYNIPIQAGAALTEKRICAVNDFDGAPESVSDRNQRYSEFSAMYWIGKNIMTDYIGIGHYRRRFQLSDEELAGYLDKGLDIVTTKDMLFLEPQYQFYKKTHYGYDWELMMDILAKRKPDYAAKAHEVFQWNHMHVCNMNIFRRDLYEEYCDFIFPVLDELYLTCPPKTDKYYRRDISFLGERLTSLFIEKKREEGCRVIEVRIRNLKSEEWNPEEECDFEDPDAVYEACRRDFAADHIRKCLGIVACAMKCGASRDVRICNLSRLFIIASEEQKVLPQTLFDYLPKQWRNDLDTLCEVWDSFGNLIKSLDKNPTEEKVILYRQFLAATGFSELAIRSQCQICGIQDADAILNYGRQQ